LSRKVVVKVLPSTSDVYGGSNILKNDIYLSHYWMLALKSGYATLHFLRAKAITAYYVDRKY